MNILLLLLLSLAYCRSYSAKQVQYSAKQVQQEHPSLDFLQLGRGSLLKKGDLTWGCLSGLCFLTGISEIPDSQMIVRGGKGLAIVVSRCQGQLEEIINLPQPSVLISFLLVNYLKLPTVHYVL